MIPTLIALVARTVAYRLALDVAIPRTSPRRERVTLQGAFLAALAVTAVSALATVVGWLPGVGLLAWGALAAVWLAIFALHWELRAWGLVVAFAAEVLAVVAARLIGWLI
jgi:hypothetical protein